MAINAKFVADFSDFQTAVQKADLSLKTFESGAGKVSTSLNKMANSLSGTSLIQQATVMAEAVARVGGVSKLTESELSRVASTAREAAAKLTAMGQEVPPGIQRIADAAGKIEPALSKADKAAGFLKSAFAQFTLAGLATNAISSLTSSLGEFASIGFSKLPAVQASFSRLTKSMQQDGSEMLSNMSDATKGMVSNYDLMLSANKAMLLGLPVTSDSMGELAKTATVLGKAMGQDATTSLNDLITALGRSSPMILDNLGLTVKVGEANEAYAAKLGKSAEALSDSEKKMAFYEAAMEAARKKTKELGDQSMTLGDIATSIWTRIGNEVSAQASRINNAFGPSEQKYAHSFFETLGLDAAQASKELSELASKIETLRAKTGKLPSVPSASKDLPSKQGPLGMSVEEMLAIGGALDKQREAMDRAAAAAKKWGETLQAAFNKWSGVDLAEQVKILDITFRRMADSGQLTEQQFKDIAKEATDLSDAGAKLTPRLQSIVNTLNAMGNADAFEAMRSAVAMVSDAVDKIGPESQKSFLEFQKAVKDVADEIDKLAATAMDGFGEVQSAVDKVAGAIDRIEMKGAQKDAEAWTNSLRNLSQAFASAADSIGGSTGRILGNIGAITNALAQASSITMKNGSAGKGGILTPLFDKDASSSEKWAAGVAGGMQVASGAVEVWRASSAAGTKSAGALAGAMSGAKAGAAFGPYGMAIGAAAGAVVGLVRAMSAGRREVKAFAEAMGGFDSLNKQLLDSLGKTGEELWIKLTQGVKKGDKAGAQKVIAEIQAALANAPDALAAAAGYQTKAELQAVADKAKSVYEYMVSSGKYTAESIADAFKKMQEAQDAAMGGSMKKQQEELDAISAKYAETISKLDQEYQSLAESVAQEAEEEVMGVVEAQQRARMEQIKDEKKKQEELRDAEIEAKKSTFDAWLQEGKKTYDDLTEVFGKELKIPYRYVPRNSPGIPDGGGSGYAPSLPGGSGMPYGFGSVATTVTLDGRAVGKAVARILPGVLTGAGR